MQILVELDGVIRDERDDGVIATGMLMYSTLTVYNRMIIMTSMSTAEAERWLNQNKIVDFDLIVDSSVGLEDEVLAERQINVSRAKGNIDLFITANPNLWVYAFEKGIPSVMLGMPSYIRPEFRPDAPKRVRSWDDISAAIDKQNEARTKDVRLTRTEGLNFGD
ncbi:hypothetical protein UFOVP45_93 [uncultured Caudovirales phage]|uniref:Uncharacterized protein n=1 Tax=uncultured Caudovirales phage TaxID=2100421 RepID=A0A6J5KSH1_9CAUD|nr:hypothetical protein UFOVP45_93 [uncultured Caudovirales phage]